VVNKVHDPIRDMQNLLERSRKLYREHKKVMGEYERIRKKLLEKNKTKTSVAQTPQQ
jgi:hypothetical protein